MLHKAKHLYSFGPFTLNVSDRALFHGGREVKLGPTAFDLLLFFVSHSGSLVSRDELKQAVWGSGNIEANNVDQKIAEIRRALVPHEYIQNSRGHGWRFIAEVTSEARPVKKAPRLEVAPSA